MKVSEIFARAAELVGGKVPLSRVDVETALRDCEARASAATSELERRAAQRPDLLIGGSDADVEKHDAAASRTMLERDRAVAIAAKLRERLATIVADEAEAERVRHRGEVELQAELAAEALRTRYPKAIAELRSLLGTVASAQKAIAGFEVVYPKEPPIADPERVARSPAPVVDKLISEREVWRWEYVSGGALQDNLYTTVREPSRRASHSDPEQPSRNIIAEIEAGTFHGSLDGPFECYGFYPVRLVRKIRREVVREPRYSVPDPLHLSLQLPGLLSGEIGWQPARFADQSNVLANLEALSKPVVRKPSIAVEYLAVDKAAAA